MTISNKKDQGRVWACRHTTWPEDIGRLCRAAGLANRLRAVRQVLIKPNLVEAVPPPVTTPVGLVIALVAWLREANPEMTILIGEGTGATAYETDHCFRELGYTELVTDYGVELVDLNNEPSMELTNPDCGRWPQMHLPRLLFESFLISVPVLKAHSLAKVTLSMKNMMGAVPPAHYQQGGHWKKASFHSGIQEAIFDLNRYRAPDFSLLDATVGMRQAHLWGPTCDPAPNLVLAGFDPVAIDAFGAGLLCRAWQDVGHLRLAHGVLGQAEPLTIDEI